MTETVITSEKQKIVLGFERRFVMIGERINPTGRKLLAEEMARGDYSRVVADALAQVEAGAQMLDVNAGIPLADEPKILADCIKLVQDTVPVPLSIDSSIVEALEAGLAAYKGKPLVNSVTGEEERLERVLPLIKKYGAAVVAISNAPRRSSSARPISASRARTSSSTPSSCLSGPSTMPAAS
jgi:5-methyltetrahydrofolate--homocysteine methyltransferase